MVFSPLLHGSVDVCVCVAGVRSVTSGVEGGGVRLYLHGLGVSQVVVLRSRLLGVLGYRAGPLLGRG